MRQAFGLFHHRGDLMHADPRRRANEPLDAAGEHEHAGRGAHRAAGHRSARAARASRRPFGTVRDQRPGDGDREALGANEFAHRHRVGDRAAGRMDEDRQSAAAEALERFGELGRRARLDPALGRKPFRAIGRACGVGAHDAHKAHRRLAARPGRRPQVGRRRRARREQSREGRARTLGRPARDVASVEAAGHRPSARPVPPAYDAALRPSRRSPRKR